MLRINNKNILTTKVPTMSLILPTILETKKVFYFLFFYFVPLMPILTIH